MEENKIEIDIADLFSLLLSKRESSRQIDIIINCFLSNKDKNIKDKINLENILFSKWLLSSIPNFTSDRKSLEILSLKYGILFETNLDPIDNKYISQANLKNKKVTIKAFTECYSIIATFIYLLFYNK